MALKSLLMCGDGNTAEILRRILLELDIRVEHCWDSPAALNKLMADQFDAIVLDCEPGNSAIEILNQARVSPLNGTALVIALVHGHDDVRQVFATSANFVLYKPISAERAKSSLRAARALMRREKRQHKRIPVHASAGIAYANVENEPATLVDLSENGTAIQCERKLPPAAKVYFQFTLPGHKKVVRLAGEVAWQDSSGRVGIHFVDVPQTSRKLLKEWLGQYSVRSPEADPRVPTHSEHLGLTTPSEPVGVRVDDGLARLRAAPSNRRGQSRHACHLGAEVYQLGMQVPYRCNLTDIGEGGCYVETASPFASRTGIEIVVRTRDMKIRIRGVVQSVHPGFGMGVQFKPRTAADHDEIQELISLLASQQALEPGLP